MSDRTELLIVDPSEDEEEHYFSVAPNESTGKLYTLQQKPWEPADGQLPWRAALHPWVGGLARDRVRNVVTFGGDLANRPTMVYSKANGDSVANFFTAPPKINDYSGITEPTYSFFNTSTQLAYGGSAYGTTTYSGASSVLSGFFKAIRNFNGKAYFAAGQYLYSVNSNNILTQIKDFGSGTFVHDIEVFNNELVIAMGEDEKMWTMDTAETFTQATDDVFMIALGRDGELCWRAESKNRMSNCIENPRTLTSWTPQSPNQYLAGDSSYSITDIVPALGTIAVIKPDGVFVPDFETVFKNQTPQLEVFPHADNGKGAFVAWGYLFVPSIVGLLQVDTGLSIPVGPELSNRIQYHFAVRAGVEWNGDIYLLCTDEDETEETFICRMTRAGASESSTPYIYFEWARLGGVEKGNLIVIYTGGTHPRMIAGYGTGLKNWVMARGAGIDIDDEAYILGPSYELETGRFIATSDYGVTVDLQGVKLIGRQPVGGTAKIAYKLDEADEYTYMKDSQDGNGREPIEASGRYSATRYALPNSSGNIIEIKLEGTLPGNTNGPNHPEWNEAWAFGVAHPEVVDIITLGVLTDRAATINALSQGRSSGDTVKMFRSWRRTKRVLEVRVPDYEEDKLIRMQVIDVEDSNIGYDDTSREAVLSSVCKVVLRRADFVEGYTS